MTETDILIIGAGPAACSAAVYTLRAGLKTVLLGGDIPGGQLLQTNDIENFPGFIIPVSGFELMDNMHKQVKRLGAEIVSDRAVKVDTSARPFVVTTAGDKQYKALSVIVATGSAARWLGVEGEEEYRGRGISACATCDGFFFKGKEVCVVGGGNTAFEDALFLTNFCKKVYLIHRRGEFRADRVTVEKAKNNPKIEMVLCSVVEKLHGDVLGLTGITVRNITNDNLREIQLQGIFVAVGSIPQTAFLAGSGVELLPAGQVKADERTRTNIEGLFAAGDCADTIYRQAVIAAGSGAKAGIEAIAYVNLVK